MSTEGSRLKRAMRALVRTPAFTVLAVLVVGLGIAVLTTVFSVSDSVLLRPPSGVRAPEEIFAVSVDLVDGQSFNTFPNAAFERFRSSAAPHADVAAYSMVPLGATREEAAVQVWGMLASPNYFRVLGALPELGRFFTADADDRDVAVLSHAAWQREFGGDRRVIGRTLTLNGRPFVVIGVAPPAFTGLTRAVGPEVWIPLRAEPELRPGSTRLSDGRAAWLQVVLRTAPGTASGLLARRLTPVASDLAGEGMLAAGVGSVHLDRADQVTGALRVGLMGLFTILLLAGGCLLLAAVSNVASMLLARASARSRDTAVRLALGISRRRLLSEFFCEGLLLGVAGAVAGVLGAVAAIGVVNGLRAPIDLPLALDARIDLRALAFASLIALAVAATFVLVPARDAWRTDIMGVLRGGCPTASRESMRLRDRFVMIQTATSVLLLAVAGAFAGAAGKALRIDPGFVTRNVVLGSVNLDTRGFSPAAGAALAVRLLQELGETPGVEAAALASSLPFGASTSRTSAAIDGGAADQGASVEFASVSSGYFRAMGTPIVRGREFDGRERAGSPPAAIVNEALAARLWGGADAVGQRVRVGTKAYEVVGVARTSRYHALNERPVPFAYLALAQEPVPMLSMVVRMRGGPAGMLKQLPRIVHHVDPTIPTVDVMTLDRHVALHFLPQRVFAGAAGAFGVVGLVLAAFGIYGLMSTVVGSRTRELGIRMALGQAPGSIRRALLRDTLRLTGRGVVAGSVLACAVIYLARSALLGIGVGELGAVLGAGATLVLAALAGGHLPARRATRIDPRIALESD